MHLDANLAMLFRRSWRAVTGQNLSVLWRLGCLSNIFDSGARLLTGDVYFVAGASESGGLLITRSDGESPLRISTSVPRLRPSVTGLISTLSSGPTTAISVPRSRKISALVGTCTILGLLGSSKVTCA